MKKIISAAVIIATLAVSLFIYSNDYYRSEGVDLSSSQGVAVSEIEEGYFFDGCGETDALIFYPGAKVEETAYAPLMRMLAARGVDCFLLKMPMKLAFLDMNKADRITEKYEYERFFLAGHSLGGAMAANYSANHPDEYGGLFLLAAYPSRDLSSVKFPILFIYGENDGVLNRKKLKKGRALTPKGSEYIIEGGNHSGFGSYGAQKDDGKSLITAEEQQRITAEKIIETVNPRSVG